MQAGGRRFDPVILHQKKIAPKGAIIVGSADDADEAQNGKFNIKAVCLRLLLY